MSAHLLALKTFNTEVQGTGITVFGTVAANNGTSKPPTVAYKVNAVAPFTTTQPVATQDVFNQPLFSHTFGSDWKENMITIQVLQAETPFILNQFFIFPVNSSTSYTNEEGDPNVPTPTWNSTTSTNVTDPSLTSSSVGEIRADRTVRVLAGLLGVSIFFAFVMATFIVLQCLRKRRQFKPHSGGLLKTYVLVPVR
jgi:hypothetical protein